MTATVCILLALITTNSQTECPARYDDLHDLQELTQQIYHKVEDNLTVVGEDYPTMNKNLLIDDTIYYCGEEIGEFDYEFLNNKE